MLNHKQKLFVAEYLKDLNATRAAIAAGYSPKTAASCASRLLTHAKIAKEVGIRTGKALAKVEVTAERVLAELAKLAFLDPRKFYRADGSLIPIPELDDDTAAALAGFEVEEAYEHFGKGQAKPIGQLKKIKFSDKGQNLERLGRHLKLFTDKIEVSGLDELAERISQARQRMS